MKKYILDKKHSDIGFKVKHLMINTVCGKFTEFLGEMIITDNDIQKSKIGFESLIDSITTKLKDRDNHLKSEDFFNSKKFPKLIFNSISVIKDVNSYKLIGLMTIKDVTKEVTLKLDYVKSTNTKLNFHISGILNRSDFNLTFGGNVDKPQMLISDEIVLEIMVEFCEVK